MKEEKQRIRPGITALKCPRCKHDGGTIFISASLRAIAELRTKRTERKVTAQCHDAKHIVDMLVYA